MLRSALAFLAILALSLTLSNIGFAADRNTYRPGQAYLKTTANSHTVCEQQCRGDAQCRGWNFVRANPRTTTGICEFNKRSANPISSPVSVSGEVLTSIDPLMSRAVPTGARTVRVGTPAITKPNPAKVMTRRVNRMPVPQQQRALQNAATQRSVAPQMTPQQQQLYRQKFLAEQRRQAQIHAQQQAAYVRSTQAYQQRAPVQQTAPAMRGNAGRNNEIANRTQVPAQPGIRPAPLPRQMPQPVRQPSLYGSLHDDLTQDFTPVPRPATAPDNLQNLDAPVSTARPVPTAPVAKQTLQAPLVPGLAGGH